jgi:hypothetical protein
MRDTQFGLELLDGFVLGFDRGFACALTLASDQGDAATAIPTDRRMDPTSRRFRMSGTHQQVLARLPRNEPDEMANPGLLNNGVICYANAIFQALAHFNHIASCSIILRQLISMMPSDSITHFVRYYIRW